MMIEALLKSHKDITDLLDQVLERKQSVQLEFAAERYALAYRARLNKFKARLRKALEEAGLPASDYELVGTTQPSPTVLQLSLQEEVYPRPQEVKWLND